MHASPSNSETVCDVKLPCFMTKTVCMSKQNNSDLDYTFKRKKINGLVPFFSFCPILDHQQSSHKSRGIFFFFFIFYANSSFVLSLTQFFPIKRMQCKTGSSVIYSCGFFKFINKTFFLFLDSPYLGILYFIQYCFSSFLKKDK